jgi:hypothetical protein
MTGSRTAVPLDATAEIVANLWYVIDDQGFIYSLRIKLYICEGAEQEKLEFLRSRCYLDYLIARPFSVPKRFGTTFVGEEESIKYAVVHHDSMGPLGGIEQLFFEGLDTMETDLPMQTRLSIPESPLMKLTALALDSDGEIVPFDLLKKT